jgi:hypothetical protein
MKKYKLYQAFVLSFFSSGFYKDVGLHWKGTGFAYLLLLLAICWIPTLIQFQFSVTDYIQNKAPAITSQIPQINIINGKASVNVAQPYTITDLDSGTVIAIIDTTGKTVSLVGTKAHVLLTKTEVMYKKSSIETRSFSLLNVQHFILNQEKVTSWLTIFRKYGTVALFPVAVAGSFMFRIVQLLIYASIGLLFAKWCNTRLPYVGLLRLSAMAITPVIIISTLVGISNFKVPWQNLLYFIMAMAYLFFGVKAVSRPEESQTTRTMQRES